MDQLWSRDIRDYPSADAIEVANADRETSSAIMPDAGAVAFDAPSTDLKKEKKDYFTTLFPAFICVFVDFFGYGVSIPILPYYAFNLLRS